MIKKTLICASFMFVTPSFADLTPAEEKIYMNALNDVLSPYVVNYAHICATEEGKKMAGAISPALDQYLNTLLRSLTSTQSVFSKKHNDFEIATYHHVVEAKKFLSKAIDKNSEDWSRNCF